MQALQPGLRILWRQHFSHGPPPLCPLRLTAEWQEAAAALYDPAPLVTSPERDPSAAALAERAKGGGKGVTLADCLEVRRQPQRAPGHMPSMACNPALLMEPSRCPTGFRIEGSSPRCTPAVHHCTPRCICLLSCQRKQLMPAGQQEACMRAAELAWPRPLARRPSWRRSSLMPTSRGTAASARTMCRRTRSWTCGPCPTCSSSCCSASRTRGGWGGWGERVVGLGRGIVVLSFPVTAAVACAVG